ncbi:MAG TPA: uracil-DNA glycosylase [Haploplasma sp.]|nr:uracil-DNA glycosylase [Haploplasma sp.]
MWEKIIENEKKQDYYIKLEELYNNAYKNSIVYPKKEDIFNVFKLTKYENIKVVILGQDPYHGYNQAHGLAFSSLDTKTPKSLLNIKKELISDLNIELSDSNDLTPWAKQGVFLLNTILTVEEKTPLSHQSFGWEEFTLNIFKEITNIDRPIVFILWGANARSYKKYITNSKHLIIESAHPSPLSAYRGFNGSRPFSKTNDYLKKNNINPIDFKI